MIELALAEIECIVRRMLLETYMFRCYKLLAEDSVNSITKEDWEGYCLDVGKVVVGKLTRFSLINMYVISFGTEHSKRVTVSVMSPAHQMMGCLSET
jgi:hypothetical protein